LVFNQLNIRKYDWVRFSDEISRNRKDMTFLPMRYCRNICFIVANN